MDIQSVIVSFEELNKTKNSITEAIKSKGVNSQGRFSSFESEIRSIPTSTGGSNEEYQALIKGIDNGNVFKLSGGRLVPIGKINSLIEDIKDNSVKIYSIQDITNVRLKSDNYKSRINYTITEESRNLTVNQKNYGDVIYKVLNVEITPIEAEVTNNETTITYSCGGIDKTVTMPIRDKKISNANNDIFWTSHILFDRYKDGNKDLKQEVSINNSETDNPIFLNGNIIIKKFKTRPAIFDKLESLQSMVDNVNAMLVFIDDSGNVEYIPVKLVKGQDKGVMSLGTDYNAGVIEIMNNKLVFHFSNISGSLGKQFIISENVSLMTNSRIINTAKSLYQKGNCRVGIAIKADGSPITTKEVKEAGMQ